MKGRANYLCRHKLYALRDQPMLSGLEEIDQFRQIAEWEQTTETGDRAEIVGLPEATRAVGQAGCALRRLPGTDVPRLPSAASSRRCGARRWKSDIIIVNHHLFFADLAIKQRGGGRAGCGHSAGGRGGDLRRGA